MEFSSWFQSAIQQRLDHVSAWIEHHPELRQFRIEEREAFNAMFSGVTKTHIPGYMEWEDRHHFNQALKNEHLYLQGIRDGAQLVLALLSDPVTSDPRAMSETESDQNKSKH